MKSLHAALLLSLSMAMVAQLPAEAGPAPHSGTSSSYKSGFSSQKSNSTPRQPAAAPANRQSGPGAFGRAAGSPASAQPQRNTSAMARDMDQSAAQANALKTLDARRAASAPQPLPPLNDTVARPPSPVYLPQPQLQPQAPVIVQQSSSGLMHGVLGFMLGRAMSQSNQPVSYPTVTGGAPAGVAGNVPAAAPTDGQVSGMPGLGTPPPAPSPQPSFGASVLRWFAWLSVISVMLWAVVYSVRKLRRLRAGNAVNYSFERS